MSAAVQTTVEEADTKLGELLDRVERGEEITIARAGRPVARLVAAPPAHDVAKARAAVEALCRFARGVAEGGARPLDDGRDSSGSARGP